MKTPEVTVVVPIYNGSAYLAETLKSLLSQTFENFELLAIDDGSTDASADIVRSLNDDRVRLIQKANGGLCHALNLGITEARSPYIARSDQDDISLPSRLAMQLQVMKDHPEVLAIFAYATKIGGKHTWSNADKYVVSHGQCKAYEPMNDGCLLGSTMFAQTAALRSVGGFRQAYYPADDWDLECRLAETGRVLVLQETLIAYRFQTSANTYRVFAEMREKSRWTKDSHRRRLQSIPELTIEQFRLAQPRDYWSRFRRYRRDASKLRMRNAGQRFLDGHYIAGAAHMFAAVLLNPEDMLGRLRRYLFRN
ncbi:MAG: glycosyltransferase [Terracidiphilus sp.]|jgi:glycosyltransferase involved in cell wall biosynthesis